MTDTNLTTVEDLNSISTENLAAMMGQVGLGKPVNAGIPRLAIEQMAENDEGERLPKGNIRLRVDGVDYYFDKDPLVRLYARYFAYDAFNAENPKESPRTVMKPSLKDDFPDSKGGNKCGKLSAQEVDALPKDSSLLAAQKAIKCTQIVYGYVHSGTAKTIEGQEQDMSGTPFVWSVRGSAFQPIWNYIAKLGQKTIMFSRVVEIRTKRNKMGSVTYFTPELEDIETLPLNDDDVGRINTIMEDIKKYNDRIVSQHKEHLKDKLTSSELDVSDSLEVA